MKIESTQKSIEKESKLLQKNAKRRALNYILAADILLLTIIMIALFSLPNIIQAYTVSKNNKTDFSMDKAEKTLLNYKNVSLLPFEEEDKEYTIDDFFNIFPEPSYPENVAFWHEYKGWYSPGSYAAYDAWGHAYDLYYAGKIHGATAGRWCTFFAQMWFYDQFGFNSSGWTPTGSGAQFASTVYNTAVYYDEEGYLQHYFEYGDKPMTMGIVSIYNSYNPEGHVLCVDEVDYFNDTITISEGNANGNGDVRIRQTMSLSEFYRLNPGYRVYVNPTPELINMLKGN